MRCTIVKLATSVFEVEVIRLTNAYANIESIEEEVCETDLG